MKYYLITFILGIAFGLFVSFMHCSLINDTSLQKPVTKITNELKKEAAKSEVGYAKAVDSLKLRSTKLQAELSNTKNELTKAKQKTYSLQLTVYDLIDRKSEDKEVHPIETNSDCDSLIVAVEELIQSSSEKDSLYEQAVINLEDQLKNRDSTITLKESQYAEIKSAFTKSVESNEELTKENKQLIKQAKRQKSKSKVLSAVLFVLTGAAINYVIHH